MRKLVHDLTGEKYNRLYVLGGADDGKRKISYYCQCDCGKTVKVRADALLSGATKSCGCLKKESYKRNIANVPAYQKYLKTGYKVGGTRLYDIWQGMKKRCYNENNPCYERYGGRGIIICEEWKNDYTVFHDWAIRNGYTDKLTIDRIDVNGNYSPDNCRWVTAKEQAGNRRSNINIKIGNATKTLKEWCDVFEVDYSRTNRRLNRNGYQGIDRLFNSILEKKGGDNKQ